MRREILFYPGKYAAGRILRFIVASWVDCRLSASAIDVLNGVFTAMKTGKILQITCYQVVSFCYSTFHLLEAPAVSPPRHTLRGIPSLFAFNASNIGVIIACICMSAQAHYDQFVTAPERTDFDEFPYSIDTC